MAIGRFLWRSLLWTQVGCLATCAPASTTTVEITTHVPASSTITALLDKTTSQESDIHITTTSYTTRTTTVYVTGTTTCTTCEDPGVPISEEDTHQQTTSSINTALSTASEDSEIITTITSSMTQTSTVFIPPASSMEGMNSSDEHSEVIPVTYVTFLSSLEIVSVYTTISSQAIWWMDGIRGYTPVPTVAWTTFTVFPMLNATVDTNNTALNETFSDVAEMAAATSTYLTDVGISVTATSISSTGTFTFWTNRASTTTATKLQVTTTTLPLPALPTTSSTAAAARLSPFKPFGWAFALVAMARSGICTEFPTSATLNRTVSAQCTPAPPLSNGLFPRVLGLLHYSTTTVSTQTVYQATTTMTLKFLTTDITTIETTVPSTAVVNATLPICQNSEANSKETEYHLAISVLVFLIVVTVGILLYL